MPFKIHPLAQEWRLLVFTAMGCQYPPQLVYVEAHMRLAAILIGLAGGTVVMQAQAQTGPYVGISGGSANLDTKFEGAGGTERDSASLHGLTVRVGNRFSDRWSAEFRAFTSDSTELDGQPQYRKGSINHGMSAFARYDFAPGGDLQVYGVVGPSAVEIEVEPSSGANFDVAATGPSVGLGIELYGSSNTALFFEYVDYIDQSVDFGTDTEVEVGVQSANVGIIHNF